MLKEKTRLILVAALISAALFFFLDKRASTGLSDYPDIQKTLKLLSNLIDLIKEDYVEEPNPSRTMEGAFRGLVNSLDVLSSYLDKESVSQYHHRFDPDLKETGIVIYKEYGSLPVVIGIKDGSPAQNSPLKIGDSIGALDDESTLPKSMLEANLHLKSLERKPIKVKIVQVNESQEIQLERRVLFPSLYSFTPDDKLAGILTIHGLYPPAVDSIRAELLPKIRTQTLPLVLDLRNCHEGNLPEAFRLINIFVQKDLIGHLERKKGTHEKVSCPAEAELKTIPLIIWTNQATLGAAEAVASVLREHRKAKIIGRKTAGLAAEQKFFPLDDGSGMVLTSAVFKPEPGEKLWNVGITPDISIDTDQDLKSYLLRTHKAISSQ